MSRPHHIRVLAASLSLAVVLTSAPAHASMFGEENATLGSILAAAIVQIDNMVEALSTARKTYDSIKTVAGYAQDAYDTYQALRTFNLTAASADDILASTFPDIAYFRGEVSGGGPWLHGNGSLRRAIRTCLMDQADAYRAAQEGRAHRPVCVELDDVLTAGEVRRNLSSLYGPVLPSYDARAQLAVDGIAAGAISGSMAAAAKGRVSQANAKAMMAACTGDNPDACRTEAQVAQIQSLNSLGQVNEQLAKQNELAAMRLAQENAKRKREVLEQIEQRQIVVDGMKAASKTQTQIKVEGYNIFGDAR